MRFSIWSISMLLLSLVFFSCEKDSLMSDGQASTLPTNQVDPTYLETPGFELKRELATSLSTAIRNNPAIMKFMAPAPHKSGRNSKRLKALTLLNNLDKELELNGLTLGEELMNSSPVLSGKYGSIKELKRKIFDTDPLISFKIPSIWYDYDFVGKGAEPVVIAYEGKEAQLAYVNGHEVTLSKDKTYFSINVQSSEEHILIEMDEDPGNETEYAFMTNCEGVRDHFAELIQADNHVEVDVYSPTVTVPIIMVDIFDDIRDVFTEVCSTEPGSFLQPPSSSCNKICKRDCGPEDNRLMGFKVSSMAALTEMGSNAPVNQMEEVYNFRVTFVTGHRTSPVAGIFTNQHPFFFDEIVETIVTVTEGEQECEIYWNSYWNEWEEECYTPTFSSISVTLRDIEFYEGDGIPIFGFNNVFQNEWSFDDLGDRMRIDWQETDNTNYNRQDGTTTSTSNQYSLNMSVGARFGLFGVDMSASIQSGWQGATTNNSQTSLQISASQRTDLGQMIVGYCDLPNHENEEPHPTGMITGHVAFFLQ